MEKSRRVKKEGLYPRKKVKGTGKRREMGRGWEGKEDEGCRMEINDEEISRLGEWMYLFVFYT